MAHILRANGKTEEVTDLSLENLQKIVGGYVEKINIPRTDQFLLVDEEGRFKNLNLNINASRLVGQPIVGDVILLTEGELE